MKRLLIILVLILAIAGAVWWQRSGRGLPGGSSPGPQDPTKDPAAAATSDPRSTGAAAVRAGPRSPVAKSPEQQQDELAKLQADIDAAQARAQELKAEYESLRTDRLRKLAESDPTYQAAVERLAGADAERKLRRSAGDGDALAAASSLWLDAQNRVNALEAKALAEDREIQSARRRQSEADYKLRDVHKKWADYQRAHQPDPRKRPR